ncbi:hypothetical protein ABIB56_003672, partial [Glaciihabitans sp. UYNi722]
SAQLSILITFHDGWWPYFQLAFLALFSNGVNTGLTRPRRRLTSTVS